uniref:CA domain-containing protein n=1 Tax=Heterorhabditis bacteriophora TaxID=37862 RepID=A0A1I7XLB3_HETBA
MEMNSTNIELKVVKGADLVDIVSGTNNLKLKQELDRDEVTPVSTGTIVFTDFEATDKDQPGPNSFIQYFILPGQFSDLLEIADPFKPVVTVKGRIDFEKDKSFEIQLEARDQGEPSCASTVPLKVTVEDANDLDPYFDHHYYIARKIQAYETDNENRNATAIISINLEENIRFEHNLYLVKPTLIRYSLRNSSDAFSIGEISGQLVFHGFENWKNGIVNYEVEATDGEETATALVTVVIDTQDYCESKLEFEKSEYHLQIGSFSVLGTVKLKRQTSPKYKLMNMNQRSVKEKKKPIHFIRDFLIDPNGVLRLHQGARPACSPCELVVVANDEQGAMGITKIIIKNPSYTVPSISIITVLLLIILTLIFTLLLVFIYKRVRYVRNYAVNTEKDKTFESAKSPAPKRAHGAHLVPVTVTNQDGAPTIYF